MLDSQPPGEDSEALPGASPTFTTFQALSRAHGSEAAPGGVQRAPGGCIPLIFCSSCRELGSGGGGGGCRSR